ncbi:MAG TPA: zinc-ribbon domain-containing protein [Candidatus Angelobacter sp.]|nr:zinc-ribbon domain-containing protein [Candidatus Angelobacter sp.]
MVHCTKCGTALSPDMRFCNKCGQEQPAVPWQSPAVAQSGLSENAAATLSYVLGWLTGIIFFLIDRRPYVRFHAAQSIVTFGGLHVIRAIVGAMFGFGWFFGGFHSGEHWGSFGAGLAVLSILGFLSFILWIVCMVKAYQGQRFMVPVAGDIAVNLAGR